MSDFIKKIQILNNELLDNEGKLREDPRLSVLEGLDVRRIKFCSDFIQTIMNSKLISNETKFYIRCIGYSVKKAGEAYNNKMKKLNLNEVNSNTFMSKVNYDRVKLEKLFGANMLDEVLDGEKPNIKIYEERLYKALNMHKANYILKDRILLDIPSKISSNYISQEKFEHLISVIKPYTVLFAKQVTQSLSDEEIGYLNYLCNSSIEKFGNDLRNFKKLESLLTDEEKAKTQFELVKNNIGINEKQIEENFEENILSEDELVKKESMQYDPEYDISDEDVVEDDEICIEENEICIEEEPEHKMIEKDGVKYQLSSINENYAVISMIDTFGMTKQRTISRKDYDENYSDWLK